MTRTYPYAAWVLQPSFKLKQVEMVKNYISWGEETAHDLTRSGKQYHLTELFSSRDAAITVGRQSLKNQRIVLDNRLISLNKKQAALDKAEKEAA